MPTQSKIKERLLTRFNSIRDEEGRPPAAIEKIAEVLAIELEHLASEQKHSEERVFQKLQQKLKGKYTSRSIPAHKIVQRYSENSSKTIIDPEQHFDLLDEKGQTNFWSPLFESKIYPIRIMQRYWMGEVWQQESFYISNWQQKSDLGFEANENEIWLGMELARDVELPDSLHLFLDCKNLVVGHDIKVVLPLIQITHNEEILESKVSPLGQVLPAESFSDWREKQWMLHEVEKPIAKKYENNFVKIQKFSQVQSKNSTREVDEPNVTEGANALVWIKLIFPFALTKEVISDLSIGFNCFPVLNRRLRNREETPYLPITTIPLKSLESQSSNSTKETFLGLQKVFYGSGAPLNAAIVNDFGEAVAGEYGLQHGGVVSFNKSEAQRQLAYIFQLLDREKAVMQNLLGQRMNNGTIRDQLTEVSRILDRLREEIGLGKEVEETWFLSCKPLGERENILVRWWVSGGVIY